MMRSLPLNPSHKALTNLVAGTIASGDEIS